MVFEVAIHQRKAGALLSYGVIFLNSASGLLLTPFMIRMMGKSEFGLYSLVISVVAYLTILDLGFGNAIIRYTAKFRAERKIKELQEMLGIFLIVYLLISCFTLFVGFCFCFNVELFFGGTMTLVQLQKTRVMLILLVLNIAITFPLSLYVSVVTAHENFVFQKSIILLRIILNFLCSVFLLIIGYRAVALVLSLTIFNMMTLFMNYWFCKYKLDFEIKFARFKWTVFKEIFSYSFYVFLNSIMNRIYWSTGQFVLGAIAGPSAVAVFAVGIQLQNVYMGLSTAIVGVFLPKVTSMVSLEKSKQAISDLFIRTGRMQYLVMAYVLTGFVLFGRVFIRIWAGDEFSDAYLITLLFFISLTIPLVQNIGIIVLQARNEMRFRSILVIILAVVSLFFQIKMAKIYGGIGCAIAISSALVIGQVIVMNIYYHSRQSIDVILFWKEIFKMSLAPFVIGVIGNWSFSFFDINSVVLLIAGVLFFTILYIPTIWFFSMNENERKLFKKLPKSLGFNLA